MGMITWSEMRQQPALAKNAYSQKCLLALTRRNNWPLKLHTSEIKAIELPQSSIRDVR